MPNPYEVELDIKPKVDENEARKEAGKAGEAAGESFRAKFRGRTKWAYAENSKSGMFGKLFKDKTSEKIHTASQTFAQAFKNIDMSGQKGSILGIAIDKLGNLFRKPESDGLSDAVKEIRDEIEQSEESAGRLRGILFKGSNTMAKLATIKSQEKKVKELEPTEEQRKLALIALNRGHHSNAEREAVKAARAAINEYEKEVRVLEKLKATEDSRTGGIFTNKFKTDFANKIQKMLGVLSDKNSIFEKKTAGDNGLIPASAYRGLRLAEISAHGLAKAMRAVKSATGSVGEKIKSSILHPFKTVSRLLTKFRNTIRQQVIRRLVSAAIEVTKQGFVNLNQYSKRFGTPFYKNVMELKRSLQYLKNAFAAMAAPIVNYFAKPLEDLMDTLANAANHIGAFLAAITGQDQFSAALKTTVKEANTAKNKLKDILGFDEINRLSGDTGESEDYSRMFEEWNPENNSFFKMVRDAFLKGNWKKLGQDLAKKLNGVVKALDAKKLGGKVGGVIDSVFQFAGGFIETIDTSEMGKKIADFFSSAIASIDWKNVGKLAGDIPTKILDLIIGFVTNVKWGDVGTAIGDFFRGALLSLTDYVKKQDWDDIGYKLGTGLVDMIKNLKPIDCIKAVWEFLKAVAEGAWGLLTGFLKGLWNGLIDEVFDGDFLVNTLGKEKANEIKEKLKFKIPVETNLDETSADQTEKDLDKKRGEWGEKFEDPYSVTTELDETSAETTESDSNSLWDTIYGIFTQKGISIGIDLPAKDPLVAAAQKLFEGVEDKFEKKILINAYIAAEDLKTDADAAIKKLNEDVASGKISKVEFKSKLKSLENVKTVLKDAQDKINDGTIKSLYYKALLKKISNDDLKLEDVQKYLDKNPVNVTVSMLASGVTNLYNQIQNYFNTHFFKVSGTVTTNIAPQGNKGKGVNSSEAVRSYASGGLPNKGDLFIANEAGPELVGTIGNRTAVTNQDQFTQGLADANQGVIAGLAAVVQAIQSKDFDVYMDSQKVGRSVTDYQNSQTRRTGRAVTI